MHVWKLTRSRDGANARRVGGVSDKLPTRFFQFKIYRRGYFFEFKNSPFQNNWHEGEKFNTTDDWSSRQIIHNCLQLKLERKFEDSPNQWNYPKSINNVIKIGERGKQLFLPKYNRLIVTRFIFLSHYCCDVNMFIYWRLILNSIKN